MDHRRTRIPRPSRARRTLTDADVEALARLVKGPRTSMVGAVAAVIGAVATLISAATAFVITMWDRLAP